MIRVVDESINLDCFPIGTVLKTRIPFVKHGQATDRLKERPVVVVEHCPDKTTNVVPVEEYDENKYVPTMGTVNIVAVSSFKPDSYTGQLQKNLNQAVDVDLEGHVGSGIHKPSKAVCDLIFNLSDGHPCTRHEYLEREYCDEIVYKYKKLEKVAPKCLSYTPRNKREGSFVGLVTSN